MADIDDIKLAQGQAKLATEEDLQKDAAGITNPNLHRRIDQDLSFITEEATILIANVEGDTLVTEDDAIILTEDNIELSAESGDALLGADEDTYVTIPTRVPGGKADYTLSVSGLNSFRTTNNITHDEDSTTDEIP